MRTAAVLAAALFAAASLSAAEDRGYTCSMRVGNPSADQSVKNSGGGGRGGSSKTKTTERSMSWPVTLSVRGPSAPRSDQIKLQCWFIGTTDGKAAMLGEKTIDVQLDEKGDFKTDVESPSEKLVKTTTTKTSGGGRGRHGRHRRGGGSTSTKTSTSGSRVTGCVIQLLVNGAVEKTFASNPGWARLAKQNPLPEAEILKIR